MTLSQGGGAPRLSSPALLPWRPLGSQGQCDFASLRSCEGRRSCSQERDVRLWGRAVEPVSLLLPLWPLLGSGHPELGRKGGREGCSGSCLSCSGTGVHTCAAGRVSIGWVAVKLCPPPTQSAQSRDKSQGPSWCLLKDSPGLCHFINLKARFP